MTSNKNIVITGGLGYIGFELCKLLSGEARFNNITVIDNRFIANQIKQLSEWGIKFVHGDILNLNIIQENVANADIVYHLAGVTDVPQTQSQSDANDLIIEQVAINGTNNILLSAPKKCKIVFASSHVVYEGMNETKFDLDETTLPSPILVYGKSKAQNEIDITNSGLEYVILRLGSAYGYTENSMRINIMPNLFAKISAQNGTIKLYSGGTQYKSIASVFDIARCFKYLGETKTESGVFHVSNENITVAEVAKICSEYSNVQLVSTNDEIPNQGYTLSNTKLKNTGFKFLFNIRDCIKNMISNWTPRLFNKSIEYVIKPQSPFRDNRGSIENYELTEPINLIGLIVSAAGSVRANHYHPVQEQKCLLITGKYISVTKDLSNLKSSICTRIINPGEIAVIEPNVAHAMVFLEDSTFLNLVRGEREHTNYGITHTIQYTLVDEIFRQQLINNYTTACRLSHSNNLLPVVSLGLSPLANNLISSKNDKVDRYPLEMVFCPDSLNCQLNYIVPPEQLFNHYLYVSSTTKSFCKHFEQAADIYIKRFNLNSQSIVVDIGSNDGIALKPLQNKGINVIGVEPATNIANIAAQQNIPTINDYFNEKVVAQIKSNYPNGVDLITASNVFAHSDKLKEMATNAFNLLKSDGCFIIEVQYILDTIKDLTFDNIYHEHVNYWSVLSLMYFFEKTIQVNIIDIEHIDTHGGSIRVYISKCAANKNVENINKFIQEETEFGLDKYDTYVKFSNRVEQAKINVNKNLQQMKEAGLKIAGYGAPAKATTALNYYGITSNDIQYIVEDNQLKHGKYIPGTGIPIVSKNRLETDTPSVVIVMAWNFFNEIKTQNQHLIDRGIQFVSIKDLQK